MTAVALIKSLAWKFLHGVGMAKKKEKKKVHLKGRENHKAELEERSGSG